MPVALFSHHFSRSTARALLAALMLAAPAMAQAKSDCTDKPTAVLSGSETVAGMFFTTQNIVMVKESGTGPYGAWRASEWTYTQSIAPNTPAQIRSAVAKAVAAAAKTAIPGLDATCKSDMQGDTVRIACTGAYKMRIHPDGSITPDGGSQVLGHMTPARGTAPAQITLSMIPVNPMYQGTATGQVQGRGAIGVHVATSASYSHTDQPRATFRVRVSIEPYNAEASRALLAGASYEGPRPSDSSITAGRDGPEAFVVISLDGSPPIRQDMEADTTVYASTEYQGCLYHYDWKLGALLLIDGIAP